MTIASIKDALVKALEGVLERYVSLADSGACGDWNPEKEEE